MAPILIDQRSMLKISTVLVFTMLLLFFSGYLIGFQKSEAHRKAIQQTLTLDLPDAVRLASNEDEIYIPEVIEPGIDRDVDEPDVITASNDVAQNKAKIEKPRHTEKEIAVVEQQTVLASAPIINEVQTQTVAVGGPVETVDDDPLALLVDSADEATARYTIQVGLFGDMDNAERKVEDLLAQRLSAYSSEFTNKKNQLLYNVRFGYFASFASARLALDTYKAVLASDGYIVKLKR
jgi:cell division septation protein DedD